MICSCGGRAPGATRTVRAREPLLKWFPDATDCPLPVRVTVTCCLACGRQDKSFLPVTKCGEPAQMSLI